MCARCKHEITNDDLIAGVVCKECGRIVNPSDVDENDICDVCRAKAERADLANASQADLIKMIIEMEKASRIPSNISVPVTTEIITENDTKDIAPETENNTNEKPRKRRARRASSEDVNSEEESNDEEPSTESETTEVSNSSEDINDNVNEIANQQSAPFPDIDINNELNTVDNDKNSEDNVETNAFTMFESDEAF